ncbi:TRAP transporter permease [Irregularibacter muris]|uniref:TRAP transporter permease n=1 Tax=Irregularibacter muris TaxID=1796619 RepID=A0AAE3HE64_9FIRM|nr:TRAP transporter permease [Irregularibacter muris]MCR1897787.1 TRAP transporter permease [Irregularibacter muris]
MSSNANNKNELLMTDAIEAEHHVEDLLEKFDKEEGNKRKLIGKVGLIITLMAIAMSIFHLYTSAFGTLLAVKQRALHLVFTVALGFLIYPFSKKASKNKIPFYDYILCALGVTVFGYLIINFQGIVAKGGQADSIDLIFGSLAILLILEVTRRSVGPELPIVAIIFLIYASKLGPNFPGLLAHRGYSFERIISHMYLTTEGILGTPVGVSATFVFMFILFGAFLDKTGVGGFFIDLAYALTGSLSSGPAMTAVVASGFMGSISGSSVANTVTTGAFTIPLMKKVGYKPYFAGAVEATASTGGQIMPPVMGAAAFIMAEFTGIPYVKIIASAAIPAILYYMAVGTMVHLEAKKLGLKGLPKSELPKLGSVMKSQGYLLIPLVTIVFFLIKGYTPLYSAFWSIIISVVIATIASLIKKDGSFNVKAFIDALEQGAKSSISVAAACATAGIVVGVVTLTGLGLNIANMIVTLAGGKLFLTLLFTMIASIILGMGLPTTAKYIVLATMAVPALTTLNVNLMAAHLFILYFGVVADITPPVALAAYAGSGIAGANAMKTGFQAVKLALAAFVVPYIFAYNPALLLIKKGTIIENGVIQYATFLEILPVIFTAILGIICLASAVENYLITESKFYERIPMLGASLALLYPEMISDIIGIVVLAFVIISQTMRKKKLNKKAASLA